MLRSGEQVMIEILKAGKDGDGSWLDIIERPFGDNIGIMVIYRRRIPDALAPAYEKVGRVEAFADLRPDLFTRPRVR